MKNISIAVTSMLFAAISLLTGCAKLNPKFEDSLNNAIMAKTGDFENCYTAALKKNPETKGDMQLKLEFEPNAKKAKSASIVATKIKDAGMKKCVVAVAQTVETVELPGTWVDGKYTLEFTAK